MKKQLMAPRYLIMTAVLIAVMLICISIGSVNIPLKNTLIVLFNSLTGKPVPEGMSKSIILSVRVPRILCTAITGAALSLCGAAMQGLLKNPLADGSTLGVSSGAALGAVIALAFGITFSGLPFGGTMCMAILFAFLSLVMILSLSYAVDHSLATNTIILIGVIFTMFTSAAMSMIIAFAGEKVKTITFWTMGSLASSTYSEVAVSGITLLICGAIILRFARELNAFSIGEENARNLGINTKAVKLILLCAVSVLIGVCVSIGGTIGFVGLIIPHITRMITGPNHKRLLPASLFTGAIFLLLADLAARTIVSPVELPIGVVTSLIGSVSFIVIFARKGRTKNA